MRSEDDSPTLATVAMFAILSTFWSYRPLTTHMRLATRNSQPQPITHSELKETKLRLVGQARDRLVELAVEKYGNLGEMFKDLDENGELRVELSKIEIDTTITPPAAPPTAQGRHAPRTPPRIPTLPLYIKRLQRKSECHSMSSARP